MTSTRPYLLRAFYEWMCDNQFTPYIVLNAEMPGVEVPKHYVENGQIILNISTEAVDALELGNDHLKFDARFSGVLRHIIAPTKAVLAIYAHENGQGVVFSEEETAEEGEDETPPPEPTKPNPKGKANLRVVK
jgi:stringent starvation protein B